MKMIKKLAFVVLTLIFGYEHTTIAQKDTLSNGWILDKSNLSDTIVDEIKTIGELTGSLVQEKSSHKVMLEEIPLKLCSDSGLFFEEGNIIATEVMVTIGTKEHQSKVYIDDLQILYYRYQIINIPQDQLKDLFCPNLVIKPRKQKRHWISPCKVYRSTDKKREYIFVPYGTSEDRKCALWIIKDRKYFTRIVN
jgi:hypothetical protein